MDDIQKNIDLAVREAIKPTIDELIHSAEDRLEVEAHKPNAIPITKRKQKEMLEETSQFLAKLLSGEEERRLIKNGFAIVIKEAESSNGGKLLLEELRSAGTRFIEFFSVKEADTTLPVFETMQDFLKISNQSLDTMYSMGYKLFQDNEIKKALSVFSLLANINNYVYEYWLAIGICYMQEKDYLRALHAFSMASLIDLPQAAPHLYSANIYLISGERELAQETLDYCLSISTKESQQSCSSMIEDLQKQLKIKNGG